MCSYILNIVKTAFEKGAEYTKEIVARMGRAGTVGERSLGYPDTGAHALGVIFKEIAGSLK
ncbi:DAK2 domain-containing protein [Bacillus cereus]|uniref:DAK2 domain-containing protein n=1 Tax=Bacillus TaxID=1386 RepID=UPI0005A36E84|nr:MULTISPECIES: DAK2 domain-containing protein [Bacillus cereus group]AJG59674.1 DAK2 domain protein [Bacillus cereus D17]MCU5058373.1 DAK2 domain-containing protein [Bacillus cereus]OOZ84158.1 dihydroxyacetone kinase [Bacillus cereus]QKI11355.1 DAK2 domain-containing protein [Bacillus cereus]USL03429.1 DAK2 domain-containing protein [Bacillus anthracis]